MADKVLSVKIKQRYDTESNWSANNPVLLAGEMAISSDRNGMYKTGNGTSTWSQLPYNNANAANTATRATQDESGNNIKSSYASSISISDHTITLKNKNGASLGTVTVPDNNTDTKNTAGSTDTSNKIFLVGATSQAANPQTYSDNQIYAMNGQLNGNSMRIAEKVTMQYNSSTESLDFVFA